MYQHDSKEQKARGIVDVFRRKAKLQTKVVNHYLAMEVVQGNMIGSDLKHESLPRRPN